MHDEIRICVLAPVLVVPVGHRMPKAVAVAVVAAVPRVNVPEPANAMLVARTSWVPYAAEQAAVIPELATTAPANKLATPGQYSPAPQAITAVESVADAALT